MGEGERRTDSSSTSILTNSTSVYLLAMALKDGSMSLQGPHQVAEKSITIYSPTIQQIQGRERDQISNRIDNSNPRKNPFDPTTGNWNSKIEAYELGGFLSGIEVELPSSWGVKRQHGRRLRRRIFGPRRRGAEPVWKKSSDLR